MLTERLGKLVFSSAIILSTVLLDQGSKALILFSNLSHTCNIGFAFGIYKNALSGLVSILTLLIIGYFLVNAVAMKLKDRDSIKIAGLSLIAGGGISNLVDRLIRGCVVDFIDLKFWPSFNLADAAISVGVAVLIFSLLVDFKKTD